MASNSFRNISSEWHHDELHRRDVLVISLEHVHDRLVSFARFNRYESIESCLDEICRLSSPYVLSTAYFGDSRLLQVRFGLGQKRFDQDEACLHADDVKQALIELLSP